MHYRKTDDLAIMNVQHRRFVFIDFENLRRIKFKKLEKVATKIFVFVRTEVENIPAALVYQIQKLGKDVRWIVVENAKGQNLNYQIAFLMGKLHQKLHLDVEFAVLSNDKALDSLIHFINSQNRSCLRVKRKKTAAEKAKENRQITQPVSPVFEEQSSSNSNDAEIEFDYIINDKPSSSIINQEYDKMIVDKTAEETVERLIRSGNRPAEIATLKHYILLNNQELSLHGNIEEIIERMKASDDIAIEEGTVIYNF